MQELGGVEHDRRDARAGQLGHGRVARVVGAPHACEDEGPPGRCAGDIVEDGALDVEPGRRSPQGVRLAGDLGDEWVRKVS